MRINIPLGVSGTCLLWIKWIKGMLGVMYIIMFINIFVMVIFFILNK